MALTATEEAQVKALIAQNAALLSLASSEPTIISKLAATKVSLADLSPATTLADADLFLVRQGSTEKSITGSLVKPSDASETVKGIVELATLAEAKVGTDTSRAITPATLSGAALGINQSFQVVTSSRNLNTTYYNTTGKAIVVYFYGSGNAANAAVNFIVDGVAIGLSSQAWTSGGAVSGSFIVPKDASYAINDASGTSAKNLWTELR